MAGFDLGSVFVTFQAKTGEFMDGVEAAQKKLGNFGDFVDRSVQSSQKFALGLAGVGAALATVGGFAVKSAGDYEQNAVAFETMLGSAAKAQKLLKQVSDFAASTPFELPQVVEGSKKLLAFGVAGDEVIKTFTTLGNVAAGVGTDKLPGLINVFGQVKAAGRLMSQDLLQFTSAGVPVIDLLAEHFKKPKEAIKDMVEQGKVSFKDLQTSLELLGGPQGRWGDLMAKQSLTFQGTLSNISDQFGRFAREIVGISSTGEIREGSIFAALVKGGTKLLEFLNANGKKITDAVLKIIDLTEKHFPIIAGIIIGGLVPAFAALAASIIATMLPLVPFMAAGAAVAYLWEKNKALLQALAIGFTAVGIAIGVTMLPALFTAITAFAALAVAVIASTWPFILIGALVTGAAYLIITNWEAVKAWFQALPAAVSGFFSEMYTGIINWMTQTWVAAKELAAAIFNGIVDFLAKLPERAAYYIGFMIGFIIRQIIELPGNLLDAGKALIAFFGWLFSTIYTNVTQWIVNTYHSVVDWIKKIPGAISSFVSSAGTAGSNVGKAIWDGFIGFMKDLPGKVVDIFKQVVAAVVNVTGELWDKAKNLAGKFWEGFKQGLGIHSPSYIEKAFMAITDQGQQTIEDMKGAITSLNRFAGGATTIAGQLMGSTTPSAVLAGAVSGGMNTPAMAGGGISVMVDLRDTMIVGTVPDDVAEQIGDGVIRSLTNNQRV